jgi:asparagine synthase (glutamine-hydrolysing)
LSGGLDSSLIASITAKIMKDHPDRFSFGNKLHTFSIGLDGGPDLKFARIVADHIGSIHHEFNFNIEDGINSIYDIIHHLETYDVTTIRASIPMYLLSRKIKAMGIKMVLSGEGADEILGGYLYFHQAPNATEFHNECVSRVADLHNFDCLRANKSTMAWGLEVRVPFLDVAFVNDALPIHPELKYKNGIEKNVLRQAFEDNDYDYLPSKILWRQKEQFSDGVGYNWIDSIKRHATDAIDDATFDTMKENFPDVTTKEEAYYRQLFNEQFHSNSSFVKRWVPKMSWDGVSYDPSGRAQKVHLNAINN